MTCLFGTQRFLRISTCFALSVVLIASVAFGDPPSGSAPEPADDPDPGVEAPKAAALRVGPPVAPPVTGYFSPVLGATFEIVQVRIPGLGQVDGAKLLDAPAAGSPLAGKGLVAGDLITHLDGDPVLDVSELDAHVQNTAVSWIPDQGRAIRNLNIFIQPGNRIGGPGRGGPGRGGPPNMKFADIDGLWDCSCGAVWTLNQNGATVTGDETDAKDSNRVVGNLNGRQFTFNYFHQRGYSGVGTFTADPTFTSMTGTIRWQDGSTVNPKLTRVIAMVGPPVQNPGGNPVGNPGAPTTYSVVGLRNNSNQQIDCEIRWNGRGNWKNVTLTPRQSWTFWMEGRGHKPEIRINFDQTGGSDIQVLGLSTATATLQGNPTIRDAAVTNISVIGGFVGITQ